MKMVIKYISREKIQVENLTEEYQIQQIHVKICKRNYLNNKQCW